MDKIGLLKLLKKQKFKYNIYNHLALNTVEESQKIRGNINGAHTKNLFIKNKKNHFFLISST